MGSTKLGPCLCRQDSACGSPVIQIPFTPNHLGQWLSVWGDPAPRGHWVMSGDICGHQDAGAPGMEGMGPRGAAQPYMPRTGPPNKEPSDPKAPQSRCSPRVPALLGQARVGTLAPGVYSS